MDFSDPVTIILPISIVIVIIQLYFIFAYKRNQIRRTWDNFVLMGDELGIKVDKPEQIKWFSSETPAFRGKYQNKFSVAVKMFSTRNKNSRKYYTQIDVSANTSMPEFAIYKQNFLMKIAKTFGMKDVLTGNDVFDKQFVLNCKDEQFAQKVFDYTLTNFYIDNSEQLTTNLVGENTYIRYTMRGYITTEKKRAEALQAIYLCVKTLTSANKHFPAN